MNPPKQQTEHQDLGVSRRALSLARMIDRLGPGKFTITLIKPESENARWDVQIAQPVTILHKELEHHSMTTNGHIDPI
jgi:hypothetical protein